MPTKSAYQQTAVEKGTQTATAGFHVCTGDDREVTGSPKRYVKAMEHKVKQIKAVRLNTGFETASWRWLFYSNTIPQHFHYITFNISLQIVKIQRMFRKYRKRRQEAAERKALMESHSYDVFDYDDTDVELEEE